MKSKTKHTDPTINWNPYQTYAWTRAQVRGWIQCYGSFAYYDGRQWQIDAKLIAAGMYRVKFVESK
jgi:hypothetical protein